MNLVADLVGDSRINLQYTLQGLPVSGEVDRVFVVKDIGQGDGVTDPQLFTSEALMFLQNASGGNVSQGSAHPVYTFCTARNWSVSTIGLDNAVKIIVGYVYQQIPYDPTIWTIESSTYTEFLETDQQYNNSNGSIASLVPIQISNYVSEWGTPVNPDGTKNPSPQGYPFNTGAGFYTVQPAPPAFGTLSAAKIRRRWDYVKTVYSPTDAMAFDAACDEYVNTVNSVPYVGNTTGSTAQNMNKPAGTVYCYDAGISFNLASGQYLARCTMVWKPEGWQPWARYTNPRTGGVPSNIWRAGVTPSGQNYNANGTAMVTEYLSTDLNQLLTLI